MRRLVAGRTSESRRFLSCRVSKEKTGSPAGRETRARSALSALEESRWTCCIIIIVLIIIIMKAFF